MPNPAITRLLSGLRGAPHDHRPSLQVFPDLAPGRVATDMGLAKAGATRGAREQPPTDSPGLDEAEARVVERIEAERRSAHATAQDEIRTYSERLSSLDFEGRLATIAQAAPAATGEFKAEAAQGRDELFRMRRRLRDAEAERDAFRAEHGLTRAARHASGGGLALKVGVLLCLLVAEVALNGAFLAKGNELGLIGGFAEALAFAALNIGVAFAAGAAGARQFFHRSAVRKAAGTVSTLAFFAFALALNLALAHYREASGTLAGEAGPQVVARLSESPLGLQDLKSWLLLGLGLMFAGIAFADAFFIYDPYPGYGGVEARLAQAHEEYIERKAALLDRLRDVRDEAMEALGEAGRDLSTRRGEHDVILESRARLARLYDAHQSHLERTGQVLLSAYREANAAARKSPPPPRFGVPFALERMPIETALPSDDERAREEVRRSVSEAQAILTRQVAEIHEAFEAAAVTYREIDDLFPEAPRALPQAA